LVSGFWFSVVTFSGVTWFQICIVQWQELTPSLNILEDMSSNEPSTITVTLDQFPAEVLYAIVSYLDVKDLVRFSRVSRYINEICNSDEVQFVICSCSHNYGLIILLPPYS
jgi:hypothetical protein